MYAELNWIAIPDLEVAKRKNKNETKQMKILPSLLTHRIEQPPVMLWPLALQCKKEKHSLTNHFYCAKRNVKEIILLTKFFYYFQEHKTK